MQKGGADAAKFQTYKADLITSRYARSYWDVKKTKNQFELFKKYDHFDKGITKNCMNIVKDKDKFLSTPFDEAAVDMLNPMVKFYKISSSDITNFPLIKKIASKKENQLFYLLERLH